jgi:ABC-type polysaccharide transport system permease subunit
VTPFVMIILLAGLQAIPREFYEAARTDGASFHLRRDSRWSIAYSEELISSTISVTLQSTDRHHGIVGQERCHNQRDS